MWETWVWFLGQEDPLEKGKATHSSILAWRIPWTVDGVTKSQTGLSDFHIHFHEKKLAQGRKHIQDEVNYAIILWNFREELYFQFNTKKDTQLVFPNIPISPLITLEVLFCIDWSQILNSTLHVYLCLIILQDFYSTIGYQDI